jgi:hypothetical protein
MSAAFLGRFEVPPRSMSTSSAISMIERIANIPMVIRRDVVAASYFLFNNTVLLYQCSPYPQR